MINLGYILVPIVIYFFALTGVDRLVTGVIKPDVEKSKFQAYVFWHTVMNQAVAVGMAYLTRAAGANIWIQALVYATVVWCWVGGGLDFVYFAMKGEMPEFDSVWWWMPFSPQTWQFGGYALITTSSLIGCWFAALGVFG